MGTEAMFGLTGKDFVILAADGQAAYSIIRLKNDADKIWKVGNMLFGCSGPSADTANFMEFIEKNVKLNELRTGIPMSTKAAASFTRNELAHALRKGPFQADLLVAGVDNEGPSLYFMDYLASSVKVNKAAHGYGAMFTLGLMDRYWKPDLTEEEAIDIIKKCIKELETRFIVDLPGYKCKIVSKTGIKEVQL
ncbi:unnamed protein product [Cladocopium goreaui]|uniref:Proteasome subunit beta n=1 Tax=Cladocopium goreaui TaxID=2562237 RepID=A0A9P1FZK0_9DINO|nr:unnamed protein product [Cladocopium goreaui]|mmetsp:Transcript_5505/g.12665  ORF Transcript_5505/g.12665 Transcript_5505/m.12665 type:complete len:193 (-) Transcript_5505:91-669(-)|eukprot:s1248_g13.t1